jgi:Acyl-CoA carboxylase epsilon subunit
MAARLVRGNVSPDELSAVIAVVAILAAASGNGQRGQTECQCPGTYPQSQWSSPQRMVRITHPHGPGGWRASAFPR